MPQSRALLVRRRTARCTAVPVIKATPGDRATCALRRDLVNNRSLKQGWRGGAGLTERCRSGRTGRSRKPLTVQAVRGFESHPLRQMSITGAEHGSVACGDASTPAALRSLRRSLRLRLSRAPCWRGASPRAMPPCSAPVMPYSDLRLGSFSGTRGHGHRCFLTKVH